jgi:hypothetical protein
VTLAGIRKALAPAVLGIVAVLTEWIATGEFNEPEVRTAIGAVVTALVVYFVRNDTSQQESPA